MLLKWHLGVPLIPEPWAGMPCPLNCGEALDPFGDHLVCCGKNKLWQRHLGIQQFISRCLQSRGLPHKLEQSSMADLKRDADILLPRWENGADWAIDVGVCHPIPTSDPNGTVKSSLDRLSNRALRKEVKYGPRCKEQNIRFFPLVLSTWGSFAPGSEHLWRTLCRRMVIRFGGVERSKDFEELSQGLSHALMAGVAAQLQSVSLARERAFATNHA